MGEMPYRTVVVTESCLTDYHGGLEEILKQLLVACNCIPKAPVREYAHSDGRIPVKYRVTIQLPREIGGGYLLPFGESRIAAVAREIAFFEAITTIRGYCTKELAGSVFMTIPCGDLDEALKRDHVSFVRDSPEMAARYLDRCTSLLEIFYLLHINLVADHEQLLDDFSDHDAVLERRRQYDAEVEYQHAHPPEEEEPMEEELEEDLGDGIVVDGVVPESNLETPTPYEPIVAREGYYINDNGWEVPDSFRDIIPTGWGTDDEDLPHYDVEPMFSGGRVRGK